MNITRKWKRNKAIKYATSHVSGVEKECLSVLMTSFTDKRLDTLLTYQNVQYQGETSGPGLAANEEQKALRRTLNDIYIKASDRSFTGTDELLEELTVLVGIAAEIMSEHDPDGTAYPHVTHFIPECILSCIDRESVGRRGLDSMDDQSIAQKRTLLTTVFLTRINAKNSFDHFSPEFDNNGYPFLAGQAQRLTWEILNFPDRVASQHASTWGSRMSRQLELQDKYGQDLSRAALLCDYPDHLVERFLNVQTASSSGRLLSQPGMSEKALDDLLNVVGSLPKSYDLTDLYSLLRKVDKYPQIKESKKASPASLHNDRRTALLQIMTTLHRVRNIYPVSAAHELITDTRLVDLVIEQPHYGALINTAIEDRKKYNHDEVLSIIDSGALGSGVL